MSEAKLNPTKKRMGRPPVDSEQINVRFQRDILNALDAAQADFDKASRPETIRFIIKEWLQSQGRLPLDPNKD